MKPATDDSPTQPTTILPLEPDDRLTRAEFERRYDAMPGLKKAELINGRVHLFVPPATSGVTADRRHTCTAAWRFLGGEVSR